MKLASLLVAGVTAQVQNTNQLFPAPAPQPTNPAGFMGGMDPMMMMMLMDDNKSGGMSKMLPLMMMGGQGGMGGMDPMMMMMMMDDDNDMSDLLPLMMMGNGGQAGAGGMNPLMMMTLLDDKCSFKTELKDLEGASDDDKKKLATGEIPFLGTTSYDASATFDQNNALSMVDYDFMACENKGGMDPMMMMMMMGGMGGQGGMGGMDPMMMMLMMDGGGMDDLLPLMMMGGQQPGQQGGMNPLMMMSLFDSDKTKADCDKEYNVKKIITLDGTSLKSETDTQTIRETISAIADKTKKQESYAKCLTDANEEGKEKSMMDKLLPLMMMGGMGGQQGGMANPAVMAAMLG